MAECSCKELQNSRGANGYELVFEPGSNSRKRGKIHAGPLVSLPYRRRSSRVIRAPRNRHSIDYQPKCDRHIRLALSPQRSDGIGDNLLGATSAGFLLVPCVGLAGDTCRCRAHRKYVARLVRRDAGMAISRRWAAAVDLGPVLLGRRWGLDHARCRALVPISPR